MHAALDVTKRSLSCAFILLTWNPKSLRNKVVLIGTGNVLEDYFVFNSHHYRAFRLKAK